MLKTLKVDLQQLLRAYGFELRQWMTNGPSVINSESSASSPQYYISDDKIAKTLGELWDSQNTLHRFPNVAWKPIGVLTSPAINQPFLKSLIQGVYKHLATKVQVESPKSKNSPGWAVDEGRQCAPVVLEDGANRSGLP
ncbi:hypothetical protein ILUMI_24357 [Ignelater luminosus]|uniref:Uncharacterized protein n=1 Tax=Ignelater luminosus TaxID=2038154 RepID=A0A8K0CAL7_IGNLU|nr:hypothetical protein ILUMI_24357 [Ignelater luminosus]